MVDLTPAATAAAGISHTFSLVELVDDPADARSRAAELLTTQAANAVRWWLARQSG
jgi:hypothetical protein